MDPSWVHNSQCLYIVLELWVQVLGTWWNMMINWLGGILFDTHPCVIDQINTGLTMHTMIQSQWLWQEMKHKQQIATMSAMSAVNWRISEGYWTDIYHVLNNSFSADFQRLEKGNISDKAVTMHNCHCLATTKTTNSLEARSPSWRELIVQVQVPPLLWFRSCNDGNSSISSMVTAVLVMATGHHRPTCIFFTD